MNVYLLERESIYYDEACGFVVIAENEHRARVVASTQAGDEGATEWLIDAGCRMIGTSTDAEGVILRDYKAG